MHLQGVRCVLKKKKKKRDLLHSHIFISTLITRKYLILFLLAKISIANYVRAKNPLFMELYGKKE